MKLSISSQGVNFLRELSLEKRGLKTLPNRLNSSSQSPLKSNKSKRRNSKSLGKEFSSMRLKLRRAILKAMPRANHLKTVEKRKKASLLFKNRRKSFSNLMMAFKEPEKPKLKSSYQQCKEILKGAEGSSNFEKSAYLDRRFKKIKQIVMEKNQVKNHKNHYFKNSFQAKQQRRRGLNINVNGERKLTQSSSTHILMRTNSSFIEKMKKLKSLNKSIKFYNSRSRERKLNITDFSKETMELQELQGLQAKFSKSKNNFLNRMSRIRDRTTKKQEMERERNIKQYRNILSSAKKIHKTFYNVIQRTKARDLGLKTEENLEKSFVVPYRSSVEKKMTKTTKRFKTLPERSYERCIRNSKMKAKRRRTFSIMEGFHEFKAKIGGVDHTMDLDVKTGMKTKQTSHKKPI